jgi:hypothetical protein
LEAEIISGRSTPIAEATIVRQKEANAVDVAGLSVKTSSSRPPQFTDLLDQEEPDALSA